LNELTSQLTAAQADVVAARSKQRSAGGTQPLADVLDNTVIANLRADIARQEAKLQDANRNLGRNHPQFRGMEAELAELKARLAGEMRQVAGSFSTTRAVSTDRAVELRAAVEAQRKKLLGLRAERDQLAVLQRDAEAAKNAYEAVERRYNQTHLETQATQTSVFLLHPAVEPVTPSSPKPLRDSAAVLVIGLVLGMAAALLREMLDRRVRCVDDVSGLLEIPVLVVLGNEAKRRSIAVERPPARVPLLR